MSNTEKETTTPACDGHNGEYSFVHAGCGRCGAYIPHEKVCCAPTPSNEVEWEARLQFEVLEDYIREAENAWRLTPLGKEEHLPKMRAHFEKLKNFIRETLAHSNKEVREVERQRIVERLRTLMKKCEVAQNKEGLTRQELWEAIGGIIVLGDAISSVKDTQ